MRLKILTLNLWNGGRLFEAAREFLVEQAADIYFLQEAYNGHGEHLESRFRTVELLQQTFPDYDSFFAPVYCDTRAKEGEIDDGQLLLSRFPLKEKDTLFIDVGYDKYDQDALTDFSRFPAGFQKAAVEIDGQLVTLLNVHGPVNLDGTQDSDRRLKMTELILTHLGPSSIVAGDFNVQEETQTISLLKEQLTSVFAGELTTTFNVKRKDLTRFPGYATAAVDMIFVSPSFSVVKKQAFPVDVSDHLPLMVEVET